MLTRIVPWYLSASSPIVLRVHRIGMEDRAEAGDERQPQRHREAERMEERQHAEHHVVGLELEDLRDRVDVRQDVAVA